MIKKVKIKKIKTNKNSNHYFNKDSDKKVTIIDIIKNADKIMKDQTP